MNPRALENPLWEVVRTIFVSEATGFKVCARALDPRRAPRNSAWACGPTIEYAIHELNRKIRLIELYDPVDQDE